MTYTVYPIACHPGEKRKLSVGCYMMIDGYTLQCEGSLEISDPDQFNDCLGIEEEEVNGEWRPVTYALVRTNEDDSTEVIDWG